MLERAHRRTYYIKTTPGREKRFLNTNIELGGGGGVYQEHGSRRVVQKEGGRKKEEGGGGGGGSGVGVWRGAS